MKHFQITTIAAVLLVGCGKPQQSPPPVEVESAEPVAAAPQQKPTSTRGKAPQILIHKAAKDGNIKQPGSSDGAATYYSVPDGIKRMSLTEAEVETLGPYIAGLFRGEKPSSENIPASLKNGQAAVYANFREAGQSRFEDWRKGSHALNALEQIIAAGVKRLGKVKKNKIDTIELNFAHSFQTKDLKEDEKFLSNIYRGIRGVEFIHNKQATRYGPTKVLATNRTLKNLIDVFAKKKNIRKNQVYGATVRTRIFEADQVLLQLGDSERAIRMIRGNQLVPIESVRFETVKSLSDAHIQWFKNNLSEDGRMTYKYWPSRGD